MDTTLTTLLHSAEQAVSIQDRHNAVERGLFEDYMFDKFIVSRLDATKLFYLRRDDRYADRYGDPLIEALWWVWKARAAIARGEQPEAYPL